MVLGLAGCMDRAGAAPGAPKTTAVGVVVMAPEKLDVDTELPARVASPMVAEIRPQVGGIIKTRRFTEGALVKAGQALYQIDAASYQAAYASAQASVAKAEAVVDANKLTAQRQAALAAIEAVSQQEHQDAQAALKQSQAELAVARAALETARINLSRTTIESPIAGLVDVSSVTPGALVTENQTTALTTVRQIDPIQVDITQSSAELLHWKRELAEGRLQRAGKDDVPVKLVLEDGTTYARTGKLKFSGVSVNTATGSITLRASFDNPDGLLLPGMYVRAVVQAAVAQQAILVPQQAVSRTSAGDASVLVVDGQNKVQKRTIVADRQVGNRWLVSDGLAAGDKVVIEGSQKVKAGEVVQAQVVTTAAAPSAGASAAGGVSAAGGAAAAVAAR
jgi:membrane fusion protein (multidrug efflux system)